MKKIKVVVRDGGMGLPGGEVGKPTLASTSKIEKKKKKKLAKPRG